MTASIHLTSFFICYARGEYVELSRISFSSDLNIEVFFTFRVQRNYIESKSDAKSPLKYLFAIEFFLLMALRIKFIKFCTKF